ncbi:MAG: Hsp70 family protein [Candidatus Paceibacterota bacterium]
MASSNIKIGIDLGTTNSEVAIDRNNEIEVVKNVFGDEYTPSVFGIDKAKNKVVGKRAYERLYKDTSEAEFKNHKAEIKRLMGTQDKIYFEREDLEMTPEEISAEILKSLKEDILKKYPDFNTTLAVITVPAAFSVLQSEATKRAGNLAGFEYVVLLQEPIAAAVAHGFNNTSDENWLVYDLGGGTFDVALVSSKDGVLSVLGHNGDNFLGGKNFDLSIVDNVIVPKILEKYSLTAFSRNNKKYQSIFAKLKYFAENAKIYLSQYDNTAIEVYGIGVDDNGEEIYLSIDFSRSDFEKLIKPFVDRTIELSQDTLKEAGVKDKSVAKIVLVGGPTQIPYVKERLAKDLKIEVDSSVDPLTVVAKGACVFAIGQKIPKELADKNRQKKDKESFSLSLNYDALTSDTEGMVSGVVEELQDSDDEYYLQIQSDSGFYSGTKVKLKNGKFFETVALEQNKTNLYWVYLFDKSGNAVPIEPDLFTITHTHTVFSGGAPLPHSIGVAVAKKDLKTNFVSTEEVFPFFEKGTALPAKRTEDGFKTARKLTKGEKDNKLDIKITEGESDIPDRNTYICELSIKGSDLPHDLPEGTEVEITIEVNESREVAVTVYIPLIDLALTEVRTYEDELVNVEQIETEFSDQKERTKKIVQNCSAEEKERLDANIQSISTSIQNAHLDEDEKRKANKQLKDLKIALDKLEKEKEMPQLVGEYRTNLESAKKIINEYADEKEREIYIDQLKEITSEGEKAIEHDDKDLLIRVNEQLQELTARALFSNPATWVYQFEKITEGNSRFLDEKEARYYTDKGRRAIEFGDVDELKRCVRSLMLLLPPEDQAEIRNNIAGITR